MSKSQSAVKNFANQIVTTSPVKKKKNQLYQVKPQEKPENEGIIVDSQDFPIQAPQDFLLITRVQKRNSRPLTVGEVHHRARQNALFKLDAEIRNLNRISDYQDVLVSRAKGGEKEEKTGPMMVAMNELKKRLYKGIDFV